MTMTMETILVPKKTPLTSNWLHTHIETVDLGPDDYRIMGIYWFKKRVEALEENQAYVRDKELRSEMELGNRARYQCGTQAIFGIVTRLFIPLLNSMQPIRWIRMMTALIGMKYPA